jgi:hypothetical protein
MIAFEEGWASACQPDMTVNAAIALARFTTFTP